jgi:hypothetical protein
MTKPATTAFSDELSAARFVLREAAEALTASGVQFVVIGGWAPYLLHRDRFGHPGTFDVDVLLDSASLDDGSFDRATEHLLGNSYLRAAKNNFQAHRILRIGNEDLVFHVDFLNERHPGNTVELIGGKGRLHSIYTPAMAAVFRYQNYRFAPDSDLAEIRLPSVETFIASKAAAAIATKRTRDAFDVFVTVLDQDGPTLAARWRSLVANDGLFRDANDALWSAVYDRDAVEKIAAVVTKLNRPAPSREDVLAAFSFLVAPVGGETASPLSRTANENHDD